MLDYITLKVIWWVLVGVLLIGFAIMDGHDMGVGALLPFVGKSDDERRAVINTIGPHWDGNQVWFITAGGAVFAAWPLVYAAAFSGFYFAMLAILFALFFRPVGFDFRNKIQNQKWRSFWDWGLFIGGAVPALVFGVAFGNVIQGVPFHYDEIMRPVYTGTFWALFNPFALLAGVVSLTMLIAHGGNYLILRTEKEIQSRAAKASVVAMIISLIGLAIGGIMTASMQGFVLHPGLDLGAAINPLQKTVSMEAGVWFANYRMYPILWLVPVVVFASGVLSIFFAMKKRGGMAFLSSSCNIFFVISMAGISIFPFVLPSTSDPRSSLTVWDCVSSELTLKIMFWVALIMTPIIIAYTTWAYRVMRGKVTVEYIKANDHTAY